MVNIKSNNNNKLKWEIRQKQMLDIENIIADSKFLGKFKCRELKWALVLESIR